MALVRSLRARVVLWVSVALVVLFAVTIVGLDIAFRGSTDRALLELLDAHADGLIAGAESGPGGELAMPVGNLDPEFQVANSGMFGAVFDADGRAIWQSLSLIGRDFPADELPEPGSEALRASRRAGLSAARGAAHGRRVGVRGQALGAVHVRDRGLARAL